jgi:tRNA modification GTPase
MELSRTIVSLVTLPVTQNIAIIRVSGPKTYEIIQKVFSRKIKKEAPEPTRVIYGKIMDGKEVVDEVIVICFYKPKSFTGEDLVEINCHGNIIIVNRIIQLLLEKGIDMAEKGEFTKQAFFNGKINLVQASAINDLIKSPSYIGNKIALHNLNPKSKSDFKWISDRLIGIIANIKVSIDYPEYDGVEYTTGKKVREEIVEIIKKLAKIKEKSEKVAVYREGLKIAVIGKPNVGKSTLLNNLLGEEKSIVSSISGTTRDVVEFKYNILGIPLILLDTAGIRETKNSLEKKGIEKTLISIKEADMIFFVVDNSRE